MLNAASDINHITRAPILGINRGKYMIEQRALMKLGVFDVRSEREKTASHLQHVIDVASLRRAAIDALAELVRFAKVFVLAMSASCVAVMLSNAIPEKTR